MKQSEPSRIRTYDQRVKSPLLYQLSYGPEALQFGDWAKRG